MSREDLRRLVRALDEDPEARAELRRAVLTDDLLGVPVRVARLEERVAEMDARLTARLDALAQSMDALAQRVDELAQRMGALAQRVDELAQRMGTLTSILSRLTGRMGDVEGRLYEVQYERWAPGRLMGLPLRRRRLLQGDRRWGLLDDALDEGRITEAQAVDLQQADLIVSGLWADGSAGYAVIEVSMGIGDHDADRAVQRAALLSKATGFQVVPVVAGERVAVSGLRPEVWVVADGRTWSPGDQRTFDVLLGVADDPTMEGPDTTT